MKKLYYLLFLVMITLASCIKTNNIPPNVLKTDETSLTVTNTLNDEALVVIEANVGWTATTTSTWLNISPVSGSGNGTLRFSIKEANSTNAERSATVTISPVNTSSMQPISITVTQPAIVNPVWSKLFGGTANDDYAAVTATSDGGYAIAGYAESNNGDISGANGGRDAMVTRLDANGNKIWSKVFGDNGNNQATSIIQTSDGGFMVLGFTDVSTPNLLTIDTWVFKLDTNGTMVWSKRFGGSRNDIASSLIATIDGGYIIAGRSNSNDGDVNGNQGNDDGWILKLDANGNKLWSKLFGGSGVDQFWKIAAANDGGFVVTGFTYSTNGDFAGNYGFSDGWVLKLDGNGNKVWSKVFGGSSFDDARSIVATADGGYIVAGSTQSNNGDIIGNKGMNDAWLFKLDANGNKVWSKVVGGTNNDQGTAVVKTSDGNYLVLATTKSNDGDVNVNRGEQDAWLVKFDQNGNKLSSKVFGGTNWEEANGTVAVSNGQYVLRGSTTSNDNDVSGNHGLFDALVMKVNIP